MLGSLIPLTFGLLLTAPADTLPTPRQIVREATLAIEGDSGASVAARWEARLGRDSADRAALLGLATLARLRYDYTSAERFYHQLLSSDSVPHDRLAAYARLGLAQGLDARGWDAKAAEGLATARAAARGAGDSVAEGEALLGLSLQRAFTEGIEVGLATLDTVGLLVPPTMYDLQTERLRQRAALKGIIGNSGARTDVAEALALAPKSGLNRLMGQALRSSAQILQFEGKQDSSIMVLRQAEEFYRRGRDRNQLATALLWHVNALLGRGDLGQADQLVRLALAEGQATQNLFAVGSGYTALGSITIFLNDYVAASAYLDSSIATFEGVGDASSAMKARDYLAVTALAAGDLAGARRQTLEVLKWYRRTQEATIEFSAHRNLAIIATRERDWAGAERALHDAHALARRLKRSLWIAELAYDDGKLALARDSLGAAERHFTSYLSTLDSSQHVLRHDARVRLADVYARRGDMTRAEREARRAWDGLERWRSSLGDSELRVLAFQVSPTEMSDRDASVVRVLAELAQGGRAVQAFELAERRRARELADRLEQARALDPRRVQPSRQGSGSRPVTQVAPDDVAGLIPDDSTAILEYVTGSLGAPTTLFVLTRGQSGGAGLESHLLAPADSLSERIARLEALIQSGDPADAISRTLGHMLLGPAVSKLGSQVRRLVIVPDGPLHRLSFDALQLDDGRYAAERYTISLAPSAAVISALWRNRAGSAAPSSGAVQLLAFGDPDFTDAEGRQHSMSGGARLERLRTSGREARLVARYAPGAVIRLRGEASAAYLKHAELRRFKVIHFATHTLVDDHVAARTALALAPGNGESGLVRPGDLAALRLDADMVVLSSCRSAGGVVVNGEGVQGLTAPLLQAGARSVVATQWEVGDRSTLNFVDALYSGIARGLPVGDALQAAKIDAIRRGVPPRVWGAFTAIGDPLVRIPLRAPGGPPRWLPLALVLTALAAGAAAYSVRTRRRRIGEAS